MNMDKVELKQFDEIGDDKLCLLPIVLRQVTLVILIHLRVHRAD